MGSADWVLWASRAFGRRAAHRAGLRVAAAVAWLAVSAGPLAAQVERGAFVQRNCLACHSSAAAAGGLVLEGVPADEPGRYPQIWEKVAQRVRAGEMPPASMPRPDAAEARAFTDSLIAELDAHARKNPYVGRPVIQRLNRKEYSNAIRDLLAIELPLAEQLPPDGQAAGFDNIGDALSMSPLLLEQYLKVARRVSQLAVGVSDPSPVTEIFQAEGPQSTWLGEGMPFGTRGGIRVEHYFPYDGEYNLRAFLEKQSLTPREGVRFFRTGVKLTAGLHEVIVTFPDEYAEHEGPVSDVSGPGGKAMGGPLDVLGTAIRPTIDFRVDGKRVKLFEIKGMSAGEAAFDGLPGPPTLGRIEISGPANITGVSETPSRKRIFVCKPQSASEEPACAKQILTTLVRRAFRRDITPAHVEPFLKTFEAVRGEENFETAIAAAVRDVLLAPDFLFRLEFSPASAEAGRAYPVSDFELASRMSFFLWNSIPDDALLDAASAGELQSPEGLEAEVRRMLADPRADTLVDNFAEQWLALRRLDELKPDAKLYPEFDPALRAAFEQETRLFLRSVVRENRSVLDLLDADYTYLNERLARHYGIPGVIGPGFRRVSLADDSRRGGLLTQGSILMATSHSGSTSPVLRGMWVLDNLLNAPPPPPPADVPALDESPVEGQELTTRQKVERHRADPTCASCHDRIDPLGFALENFDVIGRWRTEDEGGEIDPSGVLANGDDVSGVEGLKRYLTGDAERFAGATVERLLTYGLGRELDARDQPSIRRILSSAEADGYRFGDLIVAIVRSAPFQMRQAPGS